MPKGCPALAGIDLVNMGNELLHMGLPRTRGDRPSGQGVTYA